MLDLDQIRRDIQARLEELWGEIDKLRRTLGALTSRGSEPPSSDRATPTDARTASGEGAAKSARARTRRTTRTRKASSPAPASASAQTHASSGAAPAPAPARTAPGATKATVLAALEDGSAMTAGEIAAATGLGHATVSTTLSKLATSGAIAKAARGYQIRHETDSPVVDGAGRAEQTGTPTDPAVV
jgi:DNA-binding transcriptional ArsR family regulator